MPTIIVHVQNEDPVMGEVDEMPSTTDINVILKNPRKRDGKDLPYLDPSVSTVLWPMSRVNFIELMTGGAEEDFITFVRE
jgi:hypothetical protein